MTPITMYLNRFKDENSNKIEWAKESFIQLKQAMTNLPEGQFKVFIQQNKRISGWRTKFHFGHVLPLIVEYMNRNGINQILDPSTGEMIPIDVLTLHEYHKQIFNPCLVKNILNRKDAKGQTPEFIVVPMTTTKLSDSEFIGRYEEEIMATYANQYGIEFISREDFRMYFEDGKDSKMIVDITLDAMDIEYEDVEMLTLNSGKENNI
jgi:hypothetical protein